MEDRHNCLYSRQERSTTMESLRYKSFGPLTRTQNSFLNPVCVSSTRAKITKVWGEGLSEDKNSVSKFTVSILMKERPGQPIRLTAKDELADKLKLMADHDAYFSFEANLSGNPIPYLFATSIEEIESTGSQT